MKTLTEISKDLHISKGPLSRRMDKIHDFRKRFCIRKHNKLLISEKGIQLINYPKHNSTSKTFHTRRGVKDSRKLTSAKKSAVINQLLELNKVLRNKVIKLEHSRPRLPYKEMKNRIDRYNSKGAIYRLFHKLRNK